MKFKIISLLLLLFSVAQANRDRDERDAANEEALKERIQKDELYHHARAQGLQILGPDPESDESDDLELKDDHSESDQGRVEFKEKRDAKSELNDYEGGEESAKDGYNRRFRTTEVRDADEYKGFKFGTLKRAFYKLVTRMNNLESRVVRLEKIFRNRIITPYYRV